MIAKSPCPAEDPQFVSALHRLPEPVAACADEPYVGNETADENLEEAVRVALWNATEGRCDGIEAKVFGGSVVLSGTAGSAHTARRCEEQVRALAGVTSVNNLLAWDDPGEVS